MNDVKFIHGHVSVEKLSGAGSGEALKAVKNKSRGSSSNNTCSIYAQDGGGGDAFEIEFLAGNASKNAGFITDITSRFGTEKPFELLWEIFGQSQYNMDEAARQKAMIKPVGAPLVVKS